MTLTLFLVVGLLLAWFAVPFAVRKFQVRRLDRLCRSQRAIVLSYDDGPGTHLTPEVLDVLKKNRAQGTFFLIGARIDDQSQLARQVLADGHELGSHTQDHSNAWKTAPLRSARDINAGISKVAAIGGKGTLFRPPYGKVTLAGLIAGLMHGIQYAWWTVDSQDSWKPRPIEEVVATITERGGGVILMHDFDKPRRKLPDFDHKEYVLALTGRIVDLARREGFQLKTLGDVLSHAE